MFSHFARIVQKFKFTFPNIWQGTVKRFKEFLNIWWCVYLNIWWCLAKLWTDLWNIWWCLAKRLTHFLSSWWQFVKIAKDFSGETLDPVNCLLLCVFLLFLYVSYLLLMRFLSFWGCYLFGASLGASLRPPWGCAGASLGLTWGLPGFSLAKGPQVLTIVEHFIYICFGGPSGPFRWPQHLQHSNMFLVEKTVFYNIWLGFALDKVLRTA